MTIIAGIYCADYNFPQERTKVTKGHIHRFPWRGKKNLFDSSLVQSLQKGFQLRRQARAKRKQLGAAGILTKPFDPLKLAGEVATTLRW